MSAAAPEGYPGNPSLPREVRDKILSTFRHTLNLFKEGKRDDCLIGCDFILKMDPRFTPARQLLEKTRNPASDVDVTTLESVVAATPTRQERVASVETDRLLVRAAESYAARDFDAAIAAADQILQVLPGNQNAADIREKSLRKKAAQPQLEIARQRAVAALDANRPAEARAALASMRALDAEHPAVALLEGKLQAPAAREVGESTNPGLSLDDPEPPPLMRAPEPAASPMDGGGLGDLSLDSLTLDEPPGTVVPPPPGMGDPITGPLRLGGQALGGNSLGADASADLSLDFGGNQTFDHGGSTGAPPDLWSTPEPDADQGQGGYDAAASMFTSAADTSYSDTPSYSAAHEPAAPSTDDEIATLLQQGDDAARSGNRQQAIEIWSRIFLIDINNSDAVGRIEKARQEMAEGNRRAADSLKQGREKFEAGDFTAAREAFLQVLAIDETDQTARSYLDRIEQQLSRPSSGLDLSRRTPAGDVLEEEMAEAAAEPLDAAPIPARSEASKPQKAPRAPMDKRFLMALGVAAVLAVVVGVYLLWLRPSGGGAASAGSSQPAAGAAGGPSLEHATSLFRDGKVAETIAELKKIPPSSPDYARAQKLLASLSKSAGGASAEAPAGGDAAASADKPAGAAPPPEALKHREDGQKALAEKRYIDALKSLSLASASFDGDPTFAQELGAASEKVNELTPAVKLYNEGEFETAIPILWRIFQADRSNQDARSFLLRCYYNEGIGQLQNGLYPKAVESFNEVLAIDPQDNESIRHKKFAERYLKGDLDLLGRIYVRHIQQRP